MNKAFTFIEIIIVVALIGVLATFFITSFPGAQRGARDTRRQSDLKQYQVAFEQFANNNNGSYPSSGGVNIATNAINLCSFFPGVSTCPDDPQGMNLYRYIANTAGVVGTAGATQYILFARLEKPTTTSYWVFCSGGNSGCTTTLPSSSACPALTPSC